jgi:hypothetical protein
LPPSAPPASPPPTRPTTRGRRFDPSGRPPYPDP